MSVPEYEKLEFRIVLIGEDYVGKKSLLARFRNIKSSETFEFSNPPKPKKIKNEKLRGKPCDKPEIIIEQSKVRHKLDNLTNFTKIFRVEKNYFEMNCFLVPAAEKVGFSDNLNEEDEVEKLHKMKFLNVKNFLQTVVQKPSKPNLAIRYIFFFMFDITAVETFDRIKVYYDEINKILKFEKNLLRNLFPVLIGNKIDLKYPYEAIDRGLLSAYIEEKNLRYYETSGKQYFNFEAFFEKLFFDLFESEFPAFQKESFKKFFKEILTCVRTIPEQKKDQPNMSISFPGPHNYKTNVYDLSEDPGNFFCSRSSFLSNIFFLKLIKKFLLLAIIIY